VRDLALLPLMYTIFKGFFISLGYGAVAATAVYFVHGPGVFQEFVYTYTTSFNTLVSLGLILGTAWIVGRTQRIIPDTIEDAFTADQLKTTSYQHYKDLFLSRQNSVIWSSTVVLTSFLIFYLCKFPPPWAAEYAMIAAACAEYGFGVYVGRKLFRATCMLHALSDVEITRNLFKKRELDDINIYVNVVSMLTIIFGYIHMGNYYNGPFTFQGPIGESARAFLVFPAIIATPVLLFFNFYPRMVLRKLYSQSIDVAINNLKEHLRNQELSTFERLSYVIEFDKQRRDELRYSLRMTLGDLPIGLTIFVMAIQMLLGSR